MERVVYDRMAELDERHWWYRARRQILAALIRRKLKLAPGARILEIGCGTGHNVLMLKEFGEVDAIEIDEAARTLATERLGKPGGSAPLPELTGGEDGGYDLVAILDVLEHVPEDQAAMESIARKLRDSRNRGRPSALVGEPALCAAARPAFGGAFAVAGP